MSISVAITHGRTWYLLIYRYVEKSLDLRGMQIHCLCYTYYLVFYRQHCLENSTYNYMRTTSHFQQISYELCSDRSPTPVFLVLTRIGETWQYGCNLSRRSNLTSADGDQQLHQHVVDGLACCLKDINIVVSDGRCDRYSCLAVGEPRTLDNLVYIAVDSDRR